MLIYIYDGFQNTKNYYDFLYNEERKQRFSCPKNKCQYYKRKFSHKIVKFERCRNLPGYKFLIKSKNRIILDVKQNNNPEWCPIKMNRSIKNKYCYKWNGYLEDSIIVDDVKRSRKELISDIKILLDIIEKASGKVGICFNNSNIVMDRMGKILDLEEYGWAYD